MSLPQRILHSQRLIYVASAVSRNFWWLSGRSNNRWVRVACGWFLLVSKGSLARQRIFTQQDRRRA